MSEQLDESSANASESAGKLTANAKKSSSNAVFIVPQQSQSDDSSSTSLNQLINIFSPPSTTQTLSDENKKLVSMTSANKLTLIPLNLNNQSTTSPIKLPLAATSATTPIKSEPSTTKSILSPIIGTKKVIISTPNTTNAFKTTTSDVKPVISTLNNTKIFTISTQNNIKTLPQQNNQANATSLNTTNNQNKIQYVKIVNTANNTQKIQMQNIPSTSSSVVNSNGNKAIKITTISANTNNNSITTTTTNNPLATTNQNQLSEPNSTRSLSSILSTVKQQTNDTTPTTDSTMTQSGSTSALFEAINSNGQTPLASSNSNNNVKLHTYQLVSNNSQQQQQPKITTTTKTPVIQRIQYSNQPITKTIVSATTNTSTTQPQINNYKVLTQQLPSSTPAITSGVSATSQFSFKSLNTNANKLAITKTISSTNSNSNSRLTGSLDDLTGINRKQIITTVRNGEHTNLTTSNNSNKQTITQVATTNTASFNPLLVKNTAPITVSTNLSTSQPNLDENQKSTLDTFTKIFNTASPSTLASSSNSPGKQRLNLNRNSINYDQSLASPPSSQAPNHSQNSSSSALQSNQSSNNRKPCNCTKSMCLKLYCDCFAMGSFCHDCNCINCFNTLEHEDERNKAIKMVLDRNPQAFQSKIGKFTAQITLPKVTQSEEPATAAAAVSTEEIDEIQSRHIKGCNCKKSNCLKRYCECYLAKIQCSTLCKCVGCKNCDESTKALLQLANASELRKQQQQQQQQNQLIKNSKLLLANQQNSIFSTTLGSTSTTGSSFWRNGSLNRNDLIKHNSFNNFDLRASQEKLEQQQNLNRSYAVLTNESIESTCSRLIEKVAEELDHLNVDNQEADLSDELMEAIIIEEFGRCLVNLIDTVEKRNKS